MLKQIGCISVALLLMTLIEKGICAQGLEAELQKELKEKQKQEAEKTE